MPDHLLLTETENPGALMWLKKNDKVGMPPAIKKVVEKVARLRQSTPERTESLVQMTFGQWSFILQSEMPRVVGLIEQFDSSD